jgi:RNA polymerase sigma-70 factor, ECF subfamily
MTETRTDTAQDALVAALKRHEPEALAQAFQLHADRLYRLAVSILNDEVQADGVVQDTFLKLIQHIDRFEERSSLGTWLYRIATNEALGRLRRAKPQVDFAEDDGDMTTPTCFVDWQNVPEAQFADQEAAAVVQRAVEALSPALRAVFTLRDVDELSTGQTADILGISESAVKVRLHRARLALREHLAIYFAEQSS